MEGGLRRGVRTRVSMCEQGRTDAALRERKIVLLTATYQYRYECVVKHVG